MTTAMKPHLALVYRVTSYILPHSSISAGHGDKYRKFRLLAPIMFNLLITLLLLQFPIQANSRNFSSTKDPHPSADPKYSADHGLLPHISAGDMTQPK